MNMFGFHFGFIIFIVRMLLHLCTFQPRLCGEKKKKSRHGSFQSGLTLTFRLSFASDARCSVAGAHQRAAKVGFLPLLVWSVRASVFLAAD